MSQRHARETQGVDSADEYAYQHGDTFNRPGPRQLDLGTPGAAMTSATLASNGTALSVVYPADLTYSGSNLKGLFKVTEDGVNKTISTGTESGGTISLGLATAAKDDAAIEVFFDNDGTLTDTAGGLPVPSDGVIATNNSTVAPAFSAATVLATGLTIEVDAAPTPIRYTGANLKACFTVLVNAVSRTVSAATISGTKALLTVASAIDSNDTVTVDFANDTGVLRANSTTAVADIGTAITATNNSTVAP
jgi:hypothetical protein